MSEQALVFLCEELLAQAFLNKSPVLVDCLILLCELRVVLALCLILGDELLQRVGVETASLLVEERSLHEHRVCALNEHILQLCVCYGQSHLLCLILNKLCLHISVPHHVLHLIELVFVEILLTLLHLNYLGVLIYEFLKISHTDFLT